MYVCMIIKLHITAQSGPAILVILCHSHWSSQGGINDTCYEMYICMYVCMCVLVCVCGHHISQRTDQPGKIANPTRGKLNREKRIFPCSLSRLLFWSHETGPSVPSRVSLPIPHVQTEAGAYSRDCSRFSRRCPFTYTAIRQWISPEFIGSRKCILMAFTAKSPPAQSK